MALAISGLLNPEIGGRSVMPYQPDDFWKSTSSGRGILRKYVQDHGKNLYRRGVYTFIKRTAPPPVMLTFDGVPRDQCEVKRLTTGTPLQALVMLNDPTILESARVLSENLNATALSDEQKIEEAFKRILSRKPKEKEFKYLTKYLKDQKDHFSKVPQLAKQLTNIGEFPRKTALDTIQVASLMQVIHTLYNLEETITRS